MEVMQAMHHLGTGKYLAYEPRADKERTRDDAFVAARPGDKRSCGTLFGVRATTLFASSKVCITNPS